MGVKRWLIGRPLRTSEEAHQLVGRLVALPTFSADAISSTAYATEEILLVLVGGASSLALALDKLVPIAIFVAVLLAIVVSSYRQTIYAYPGGGGSYIVSRENLGRLPSLVAAASLMIDYVLTVAVSISAGVEAIVSLPGLRSWSGHAVWLCLAAIAVITVANLRGLRQSGAVFAVPTYTYVAVMALVVGVGLARVFFGHQAPIPFDPHAFQGTKVVGGTLGLFLLLKGVSSGAIALTGVEAISNGVPAFREPRSRLAAQTMTAMALILGSLFLGVSILAHDLRAYPSSQQTVLSEIGSAVLGRGVLYVVLQIATADILTLAANTAYADFPRLASILAADRFAPIRLARRGDRLVFSNGILVLATAAAVLIVVCDGQTSALIPLYAVGVFTAFTLSQAGMVRHHRRRREAGWRWRSTINTVGAVATGAMLVVIATTKFTSGAWIPLVVMPIGVAILAGANRRYRRHEADVAVADGQVEVAVTTTVAVVLVRDVNRGAVAALRHARSLHPDVLRAVHVAVDPDDGHDLRQRWDRLDLGVDLVVVDSPYREFGHAIERVLQQLRDEHPEAAISLVVTHRAGRSLVDGVLHGESLVVLEERVMNDLGVAIVRVPYDTDLRPDQVGWG